MESISMENLRQLNAGTLEKYTYLQTILTRPHLFSSLNLNVELEKRGCFVLHLNAMSEYTITWTILVVYFRNDFTKRYCFEILKEVRFVGNITYGWIQQIKGWRKLTIFLSCYKFRRVRAHILSWVLLTLHMELIIFRDGVKKRFCGGLLIPLNLLIYTI